MTSPVAPDTASSQQWFTLDDAVAFAARAHRDQRDKAGEPYIRHVIRVTERVATYGLDEPLRSQAMMTAALHDVVEDTSYSLEDLRVRQAPEEVVEAVALLSRNVQEEVCPVTYGGYILNLSNNPISTVVKWADLTDNLLPWRMERLDPEERESLTERYISALETLIPSLVRYINSARALTDLLEQ